jgi:hypothetical protein
VGKLITMDTTYSALRLIHVMDANSFVRLLEPGMRHLMTENIILVIGKAIRMRPVMVTGNAKLMPIGSMGYLLLLAQVYLNVTGGTTFASKCSKVQQWPVTRR